MVTRLTAVCPVEEVLSDARNGNLSGSGPWSNQPTLLTNW